MKSELIKTTVRVGNSAGVILPKEWLNTEVKIILQPLNIEREIIEILLNENLLKNVLGLYLVGSYARKEQTIDSDIDILVITDKINRHMKIDKYDIILISKKILEEKLKKDILPILPMLKEAKVIINEEFKEEYSKTKISLNNLKWYIDSTEKMMDEVKGDIEFSKKLNKKVSDASSYSLILRLRTLYIIDCLRKREISKNKQFIEQVKRISGSDIAYKRYLKSKNYNTKDYELPVNEAEKLSDYILKKTKETKKWLKEKKD